MRVLEPRGGTTRVVQLWKNNTTPRDKLYDGMWSIAPYCTTRVVPPLTRTSMHETTPPTHQASPQIVEVDEECGGDDNEHDYEN